jgi:hypothetical protein
MVPECQASRGRMKVEVLVSVDVVESKPRCLIGAKLRFDLRPDLRPNRWPRAYLKPEARKVRAQMPACVNEIGQPFGRQLRPTVDEYQMQTDAQTGETARARLRPPRQRRRPSGLPL